MSANFILELQLNISEKDRYHNDRALECGRHIYNATLKYALNHWNSMKQLKVYKSLLKEYISVKDSDNEVDRIHKSRVSNDLTQLRMQYKLSRYQLESYATKYKNNHNYDKYIDSNSILNIVGSVWQAIEKLIFYKCKRVHFCKYGNFNSLTGKTNKQGIRFIKPGEKVNRKVSETYKVVWNNREMSVKVRKNDLYAHEVLETKKVKFCKLVRKVIRGKFKYYIQLVFDGVPPVKRNTDGSFRHKVNLNERVGLDIGTTTLATVSKTSVSLEKLGSDEIVSINKEINRLYRKLDRSRRASNSKNYNEDGTIKRGTKLEWVRSKSYIVTLMKLKEKYRLKSAKLKLCHNIMTNRILELGSNVYVENMNFKGLAKKSKETKVSKKTSRIKSKKRFGKSIQNFAPSMFLTILNRKLTYIDKKLNKVKTASFKASQYNHHSNKFIKKKLSNRWNYVDKYKVQRDLYSAFLIMNSKTNLKQTDRNLCIENFDNFIKLHDNEISRLENCIYKVPTSFGIKQNIC